MRKYSRLGQVSPLATHLLCFFMGASCLFLTKDDGVLDKWKGIMVNISEGKAGGLEGQVFITRTRGKDSCLLWNDPILLFRERGGNPALLLPRTVETTSLLSLIIRGRYQLKKDVTGMQACGASLPEVSYG